MPSRQKSFFFLRKESWRRWLRTAHKSPICFVSLFRNDQIFLFILSKVGKHLLTSHQFSKFSRSIELSFIQIILWRCHFPLVILSYFFCSKQNLLFLFCLILLISSKSQNYNKNFQSLLSSYNIINSSRKPSFHRSSTLFNINPQEFQLSSLELFSKLSSLVKTVQFVYENSLPN